MKVIFVIIAFVAFVFCFYNLDKKPFEVWDEATNVQVVTETLESDNPFILRIHNQGFFEKPPLWYYLTFISVKLFGSNPFSVRLISALSGFLIIVASYYIGAKLYSNFAGAVSSILLLSTGHLFLTSPGGIFSTHNFRSADLDSLMILFMLLSFYFYYLVVKGNKLALLYASLFSGLSVLSKGLLGIIPGVVFIIYILFFRKKNKLDNRLIILSIVLFSVIVFPWHLLMYLRYGSEFLNEYFGYHFIQRIITPVEGHNEPWYYYIQTLFNKQIFLGFELLIFSLAYFLKKKSRRLQYRNFSLMAVILLIFLTATLTQTRLSWYIMPIYPFAALLVGGFIDDLLKMLDRYFRV